MTAAHERAREVAAPASRVWSIWTDTSTWPQWNPDVSSITLDGPFAGGITGRMTTRSSGGRTHAIRLVDVQPGRQFSLETKPVPGATFTFVCCVFETGASSSRITQGVDIRGPMGPLFRPMMGNRIAAGFEPILQALALRAEMAE